MVKRYKNQSLSWIILIHQLPVKPEALRMSIWRELRKVGAYALKNSIYVLPDLLGNYEHLEKIALKIRENGGDCYLLQSEEINGIKSEILKLYFKSNADKIFAELNLELESFLKSLKNITRSEDRLMKAGKADLSNSIKAIAESCNIICVYQKSPCHIRPLQSQKMASPPIGLTPQNFAEYRQ